MSKRSGAPRGPSRRRFGTVLAALWLGGAVAAGGALVDGLHLLGRGAVRPVPPRLAAGLELIRECSAVGATESELVVWSRSAPDDPEAFGYLWTLASYRELPRPIVPLFPTLAIDELVAARRLDTDLAAELRRRSASLASLEGVERFAVWRNPSDGAPRCTDLQGGEAFEVAAGTTFGICCARAGAGR